MANTAGSTGGLSYSQLEQLWTQAGGSKSLAPVMAAIAVAESGGNPGAVNPNDNGGTQSSFGLWQISTGTHTPPASNWSNPLENARLAVAKYQSQGLGAWGTYTSGAYKQYLHGAGVPPGANTGGPQSSGLSSLASTTTGALSSAGALLHGTAVVLDRAFGLFAPGQGWRILFGAGAIGAGYGSYQTFRSTTSAGDEDGGIGGLPLAILLLGVAAVAAFLAARPWPQAAGAPIKPGAYVVDVLEGHPPPAGPATFSPTEVTLTEAGLGTLLGLWAAGKIGQSVSGLAGGIGAAGGLIGSVWAWIKGLGSGAGAAAGEAGAGLPPIEAVP